MCFSEIFLGKPLVRKRIMKHNQTIRSVRVLTVLLGVSLVAEGFLNLITVLTAVRRTQKIFPEIIDSD